MERPSRSHAYRCAFGKGPAVTFRLSGLPFLVVFTALAGFTLVQAQESAPVPIHWSAALPAGTRSLQPGQRVALAFSGEIDSGWHVYAFPQPPDSPVIATEVTVPDGQALALTGEIKPPKPQSQMDPTVGKETTIYENSVTFDLPLRVARKANGKQNLEVDVRYQACNNRMCLPPRTDKVTVPVDISGRP